MNNELILVVPRSQIFPEGSWHGIKTVQCDDYLSLIHEHKQFLWRAEMETDEHYKQIIPYLVFEHNNTYFLMQRKVTASEARLQNKYTLGIGGHIRQEDMSGKTIVEWARREFEEEVDFEGTLSFTPLGIINDDSNAVGKVHLGFVCLVTGDTDKIKIKSELKEGFLLSLNECQHFYGKMESWSQMVFDYLKSR